MITRLRASVRRVLAGLGRDDELVKGTFIVFALSLVLLNSCTALHPAVEVKDFEGIAGTYQGKFQDNKWDKPEETLALGKDGSYVIRTPQGSRSGRMQIVDGKIQGTDAGGAAITANVLNCEGIRLLVVSTGKEATDYYSSDPYPWGCKVDPAEVAKGGGALLRGAGVVLLGVLYGLTLFAP